MNKALEQKLIGPMEESHTKEQSPQAVLWEVLELDGDFFGRKKKCVGAGISGGEPPWAHEAGGAPYRGGAHHPRGQVAAPPAVIFAQ